MPVYEYKCDKCAEVFEVIQKFVDEPLLIHEKCGGNLERLISAPALQFKGSGFYVNDYAKGNGGAKSSKSESKGSNEGSSKSDSSSSDAKSSDSKSSDSKSSDSKSSESKSSESKSSDSKSSESKASSSDKS